MADEELTEAISIRISKEDRELLEALAARLPMKPISIARVALRLGLAKIEEDPANLFKTPENLRSVRESLARGEDVPFAKKAGAAMQAASEHTRRAKKR